MTRLDALLIALALFTVGIATGCVLTNVVGPEPTPAATVTVTAPPRTVEVTRATRSHSRGQLPAIHPTPKTTSDGARGGLPGGAARVSDTPATGRYQTYARALVTSHEWPCLRTLWQRESGWDPTQRTGSHFGIAQRRGEKSTDYRRQIDQGISYLRHRYGDACDALAHSDRYGWY